MKVVKGILSFLIGTVMTMLLLALTFSFIFKSVIQKQIIGGVAKEQIITNYLENSDVENKEEIQKLLEENEAVTIANNVIDEYMVYVKDNNHKVSEKTVDSIINYCIKHREELEKISGEKIPESEITSPETRSNLTKSINEAFGDINENLGDAQEVVVKVYSSLISTSFRATLIIICIILIILLILIKNSPYKWMSTVGISLISCGTTIILLYFILSIIIENILKNQKIELAIKLDDILVIGIIEAAIGIILMITKIILDKTLNKNNNIPKKSGNSTFTIISKDSSPVEPTAPKDENVVTVTSKPVESETQTPVQQIDSEAPQTEVIESTSQSISEPEVHEDISSDIPVQESSNIEISSQESNNNDLQ